MGTGHSVNFGNNGHDFNITLDSTGHLNFKSEGKNGGGNPRMTIHPEGDEVSFDGFITVASTATLGGSGQDGGLQLKAADGDDTIFLGSTDTEAHALLGTNGRSGRIQLKNGDGKINVDLFADNNIAAGGGQLNVNVNGIPTIVLDGTFATVTVGSSALGGTIIVQDTTGAKTIVLNGTTGDIQCKTINGK
jgi:hypothetical protein